MLALLGSIRVLHQRILGGQSQNADTADALEGDGGSWPKCGHADTLKVRCGRVETKIKH